MKTVCKVKIKAWSTDARRCGARRERERERAVGRVRVTAHAPRRAAARLVKPLIGTVWIPPGGPGGEAEPLGRASYGVDYSFFPTIVGNFLEPLLSRVKLSQLSLHVELS